MSADGRKAAPRGLGEDGPRVACPSIHIATAGL
jgi:hypothetical protein